MSHGNARMTPAGRLLLVQRVTAGEPQAEVARQMRLSRATMAKWWGRWVEHGDAGLTERTGVPASTIWAGPVGQHEIDRRTAPPDGQCAAMSGRRRAN